MYYQCGVCIRGEGSELTVFELFQGPLHQGRFTDPGYAGDEEVIHDALLCGGRVRSGTSGRYKHRKQQQTSANQ